MKKNLSLKHLYAPPARAYEGGRKNPLLVLVHGYGADENDLYSLAGEFPDVFHVVAPRAPIDLAWGGAAWYSLDFTNGEKFTCEAEAVAARDILHTFINEAVEAYDADPANVWYLGFSQGAILGYGIMTTYPHRVRYFMPLSGYLEKSIVNYAVSPEDLCGIKVFATHGQVDPVIPVQWARLVKPFMESKGVDFTYNEYYMGHGIHPSGLSLMRGWIDENLQKDNEINF